MVASLVFDWIEDDVCSEIRSHGPGGGGVALEPRGGDGDARPSRVWTKTRQMTMPYGRDLRVRVGVRLYLAHMPVSLINTTCELGTYDMSLSVMIEMR
jgi:hypothetical protein